MKFKSSWFGSGGDSPARHGEGSLDRAPLASYLAAPASVPPPVPVPGHPSAAVSAGSQAYAPLQAAAAAVPPPPPALQTAGASASSSSTAIPQGGPASPPAPELPSKVPLASL